MQPAGIFLDVLILFCLCGSLFCCCCFSSIIWHYRMSIFISASLENTPSPSLPSPSFFLLAEKLACLQFAGALLSKRLKQPLDKVWRCTWDELHVEQREEWEAIFSPKPGHGLHGETLLACGVMSCAARRAKHTCVSPGPCRYTRALVLHSNISPVTLISEISFENKVIILVNL